MELLVNDLSVHGQFGDVASFRTAITRLMSMRNLSKQYGIELYCHRNMAHAQVTKSLIMPQMVGKFSQAERNALMQWLTRYGPYWEDDRQHGQDDYLECNGQIVTDSALGEAAFRCFHAGEAQVVSLIPSDWEGSPLSVWWRENDSDDVEEQIVNHINKETLEKSLRSTSPAITSWQQLESVCCTRFSNLNFSADAFMPLEGHPFVPGAAQRIVERIDVLNRLKTCFDANGNRTVEGNQLYQDYFTGDKAWFSDSSNKEKRNFKNEMTFRHPDRSGETLFCTMHGKVKTPQIRIHFSWPITASTPLYVVYVGYKITKK